MSTRFKVGLLGVTVVAGLWLTAAPRADQQIGVKSIPVPSVAMPRVTVPKVTAPVTTPLPGQSVKPTVLMVTDRALSSNQ